MSSNETQVDPLEAEAAAVIQTNLGIHLGPYMIALFIDAIMCGVMVMQFSHWASFGRSDNMRTKAIVVGSFFLGIATSINMIAFNMHAFVYGFGTYKQFVETHWATYFFVADGTMALLVQIFFAERAYRLVNNSKAFLIVIGLHMFFAFACSIVAAIEFHLLSSTFYTSTIRRAFYCWLSGQVAADLVLTCTIMHGLIRSRTGWSQTDRIVKRLMRLSVETQLPPTVVALVFMINYSINPLSVIDGVFTLVMSKYYICGLLGALNSRYALRRQLETDVAGANTYNAGKCNLPTHATIHVATEIYTDSHRTSTIAVELDRIHYPQATA